MAIKNISLAEALCEPITYIYALCDNSGVRYIGKADNIEKRFKDHMRVAKNPRSKEYKYPKYNWIRRHREEIYYKPIETCSINTWQEREKYWISYYKNKVDLTNLSDGGMEFREVITDKVRKRRKLKMEEYLKSHPNPMQGKNHTQEAKDKISILNSIKIAQYDLEGNFVKVWKSVTEAATFYNTRRWNITRICRDNTGTAIGFQWRYITENTNIYNKIESSAIRVRNRILQYDLNGNFIKEWCRVIDIKEAKISSPSCVVACLKGRQHSAGGFIWEYKNN